MPEAFAPQTHKFTFHGPETLDSFTRESIPYQYLTEGDEKWVFRDGAEVVKIYKPDEKDPRTKFQHNIDDYGELQKTPLTEFLVPIVGYEWAIAGEESGFIGYRQPLLNITLFEAIDESNAQLITPVVVEKLKHLRRILWQMRYRTDDPDAPLPSSHIWTTPNLAVDDQENVWIIEYEIFAPREDWLFEWDEGMKSFDNDTRALGLDL